MKKIVGVGIILPVSILALSMVKLDSAQSHRHSDVQLAQGCDVSLKAFQDAKTVVRENGLRSEIGRCTLWRDKDGIITMSAEKLDPKSI